MTQPLEGGPARPPAICRDGDPVPRPGAVAAIGNFDGVHLGHRRLVEAAREAARTDGYAVAVLTFEPHPRDVFRPDSPSFRLTPEPVKLKVLGALGVEIAFVRRFDLAFAATGAAAFVGDLLVQDLRLSQVVVGANFHFGRGREGTPELLAALAREHGLSARVEPAVSHEGEPVSSSRIRDLLAAGEIADANRLLGYRWFVQGEVVHGEKRGRTLGYPTANVALRPGCRLRHGIYAVRIATAPGVTHGGVASYGRRPTFDDGPPLLETFVFDFAGDLYGRTIEVEFLGFIRGEERFGSAEDLIVAMDRDAGRAREMIAMGWGEPSLIG